MKHHPVRCTRAPKPLPREEQLAWSIAEVAADPVEVVAEVTEMIINRVIDNASVATASLRRAPIVAARGQAEAHPFGPPGGAGATVFGIHGRFSPEWAAYANGVAVRELDYHDTFLAAEYSHPGDNIPPILAVAQHAGEDGAALVRGDRDRLRDPGRPREGDLPARAQDRPRRPPRPERGGRHRHAPRPAGRDDLPGHRPGAAHDDRDAAVAQGRDLDLEGLRPRVRRQDGDRGRRPRHARPDQPHARSGRARTA